LYSPLILKIMSRSLFVITLLLLFCTLCVMVNGQVEQVDPMPVSLMEIGAESTISLEADKPVQDIAHLLVEAKNNINRLNKSREPYNVIRNHIQIRKHTTLFPILKTNYTRELVTT